jgi:hypothetical protein
LVSVQVRQVKEHDIQQTCVYHSGFQKEQRDIQPEINNASYQEEKIHNDPFPGAVMNPGSSFSKELNTAAKYSISGGQSVHKAMQIN